MTPEPDSRPNEDQQEGVAEAMGTDKEGTAPQDLADLDAAVEDAED